MRTLHVVSHTHWDREWFLPFQQFRLRLVDLIDHLLNLMDSDPEFRYFNLDAQTIVLEDYLQIKPENRERLENYIREGRITVGPWYELNDEFLTSGEATVRSLLEGHRIADEFGACMKIGYLPDQFGNISQMPQILRGFGIDNAIVGRGYHLGGQRKMEFWWEAPDGSRVLTSLMAFWYNNAQRFPADPEQALQYTRQIRDRMTAASKSSHLLLMNGVDHLEPQYDLSPILKTLQKTLAEEHDTIIHSTLPAYIGSLQKEVEEKSLKLDVHHGELREDRGGSCLAGTLSTRIYLKQANDLCQTLLEKYAEPLSVLAVMAGAEYPRGALRYAWRLLMSNHPHDSICGCSGDQVHREMVPRFEQVEQVAGAVIDRSLDALTQSSLNADRPNQPDTLATILAVNSLTWSRTDPLIVTLDFPLGEPARDNPARDDSRAPHTFRIIDDQDKETAYHLISAETFINTVTSPVELPRPQWIRRYTFEMLAEEVPAAGFRSYRVVAGRPTWSAPNSDALEDLAWACRNISILYEDGGDVGDEYLYRPPLEDAVRFLPLAQMPDAVETTPISVCGVYESQWNLPASATADHQSRLDETVECKVRTRIKRYFGAPRIEIEADVINRAKDHRIRIRFVNGLLRNVETYAENPYDVVSRPIRNPLESEGASPFYPQQGWCCLTGRGESGAETMTVINRGLPEYQPFESESGSALAITLLRCVGQLSGRGDGPGISTPDAQCLGRHRFHLALLQNEGAWCENAVWRQSEQFRVPLRAFAKTGCTPTVNQRSFIKIEPDSLLATAVKAAERSDSIIVRFFNTTEQPVSSGSLWVAGVKRAYRVNLNEERLNELPLADGKIALNAGPKEIITVEIELGGGD